MENLWQRLKPAVKTKILAEKTEYPYLVDSIERELRANVVWSDLTISTAKSVVNFSHETLFSVTQGDFIFGDKFLKPWKKND